MRKLGNDLLSITHIWKTWLQVSWLLVWATFPHSVTESSSGKQISTRKYTTYYNCMPPTYDHYVKLRSSNLQPWHYQPSHSHVLMLRVRKQFAEGFLGVSWLCPPLFIPEKQMCFLPERLPNPCETHQTHMHLGFAFSVFSKLVLPCQVRITQGTEIKIHYCGPWNLSTNQNFWKWGPFWKSTLVILLHMNT